MEEIWRLKSQTGRQILGRLRLVEKRFENSCPEAIARSFSFSRREWHLDVSFDLRSLARHAQKAAENNTSLSR